jgi:prephenate dehydrogenase
MTVHTTAKEPVCEVAAIVGVGLIGGSLAAALRSRGLAREVVGVGRSPSRLNLARDLGQIDRASTSLAEAAHAADLIVFCTPVDRIVEGVREAAVVCRPGTVITDAGSVKKWICDELGANPAPKVQFVGSHPMAGSERQGCQYADPELFQGRRCVVTPLPQSDRASVERIARMWRGVGGEVVQLSPEEHDTLVARASHVPHVVAAALAATLPPRAYPLAATGFRDTTRIAGGDPELWTQILRQNRDEVDAGLESVIETLRKFQQSLGEEDPGRLFELLRDGALSRDRWLRVFQEGGSSREKSRNPEDSNAVGN